MLLVIFVGCSQKDVQNVSSAASVSSATDTAASSTEESAAASSEDVIEKTNVNVLAISGPTGIGMAEMMRKNENGETQNAYQFSITSTPSDAMTAIVSGSADIAACPLNLAAKICQKTENEVQVLAVNTLGVLYIVTNGVEINSFTELDGKEVIASGEGATPEYAMKYLCDAYEIQVDLNFVDEFSTAATMVASGEAQIALLAEPSVSSALVKNSDLQVALNLTQIWREAGEAGKIEKVELAQGCVIVRSEFANEHPEAIEAFLSEYAESISYVSDPENLDDAASLCETYEIVPKAAIAKMAIPNCNLVCITGEEMKTIVTENLRVLFQYDSASIGGAMPSESFYYVAQ